MLREGYLKNCLLNFFFGFTKLKKTKLKIPSK